MAVARMRKVTIYAFREIRKEVFEKLRDLEIMHVTATREEPGFSDDDAASSLMPALEGSLGETIGKLATISSYLAKYNPVKKGFIDMFTGKKPEMSIDEFRRIVEEYDIDSLHHELSEHDGRKKQIDLELSQISAAREALAPWTDLDIPLELVSSTLRTGSFLAVVPVSSWETALEELQDKPVHWETVWQEGSRAGLWVIADSDELDKARSVVTSAGGAVVDPAGAWASASVSGKPGRASEAIRVLDARASDLAAESEKILQADLSTSERLIEVLALADYYSDKKNLEEVQGMVGRTRYTLVIEGYVKARDVGLLRESMSELKELCLIDEEPQDIKEVPVYLENHPIIRPFEVITNIFGFPRYDEIDPTPVLAPFFWVFFGICLGDAVYGILLTLGAWYFLKTQKLADDKLVRLLMYSGVSTFLAGALMGSWLGDLPSVFFPGSWFDRATQAIAVVSPVDDPLTLLVISLALGIFQIWVGIFMKMYTTILEGDVIEAIVSHGSWVLFLPGLIGTVLWKSGILASSAPYYIMIVGALMVMYGASRGQKNILLKPFVGVYGLYGIVGYFSDALSYSRLLALGLASAIIGVVVNKMADLVATMIPVVGWILVPVVLAGGHLFNMVINVLGSFIHSGRLQFVEFFTKFFEGGGRQFKPLKRVSDNVSLS